MRVKRKEGDLFQGRAGCVSLFTLGTVCSDLPGAQGFVLSDYLGTVFNRSDSDQWEEKEPRLSHCKLNLAKQCGKSLHLWSRMEKSYPI